jgi:Domain of unknown function (DUF1911)/Domain of unknown function (DUF1910)
MLWAFILLRGESVRDALMSEDYFRQSIDFMRTTIESFESKLRTKSDTLKKPQILAMAVASYKLQSLIAGYSIGHSLDELKSSIGGVIDSWEKSLSFKGSSKIDLRYLDNYVRSVWLLSLGIIFNIHQGDWNRLLVCIGSEGQDNLVEKLIACRTPGRQRSNRLIHKNIYSDLYKATESKSYLDVQQFLSSWYDKMDDIGWHDCHKGPEGGGYVGYWAIEAAGVVAAFDIDHSKLKGIKYYPFDLAEYAKKGA